MTEQKREAELPVADIPNEVDRLKREIEHFTKSGIIEVAIRNQSVSDYMKHWEGRAISAEEKLAEALKALEAAKNRMRNSRGAIESDQVVDKDVHGSLTRGMSDIDAALKAIQAVTPRGEDERLRKKLAEAVKVIEQATAALSPLCPESEECIQAYFADRAARSFLKSLSSNKEGSNNG